MTTARFPLLCVVMAVGSLLAPRYDSTADERNLARGKKLYEKYCQACHGAQGRGDGITRFDPPVADLTSSEVLLKPDSRLLKSIHEGKPNTAMGTWKGVMADEAIRDVLAYILTFPR